MEEKWKNLLDEDQLDAVHRMKNACILCGKVGLGKSRTALAYYEKDYNDIFMTKGVEMPLFVITTAKKRDDGDWAEEAKTCGVPFADKLVVDSWNNIEKYKEVKGAFFIFDEQRVVGSGPWVKAFLKIAKSNRWVLLSATPGDTWKDYIPVFIANGFYKNRSEFTREHFIYSPFTNYPKITGYLSEQKLYRLRDQIIVHLYGEKNVKENVIPIITDYDFRLYRETMKNRWNPWTNLPIDTAGELCYALRRVCNSDPSRLKAVRDILAEHPCVIIFYNFDYELEMLRSFCTENGIIFSEWNGHKHEKIPDGGKWAYLVQYTSGCEGWNCIRTDTMIFFSQNYSYKVIVQASGRISRRNTPYENLYYYHLKSRSSIDLAISRAMLNKKEFNEKGFIQKWQLEKK